MAPVLRKRTRSQTAGSPASPGSFAASQARPKKAARAGKAGNAGKSTKAAKPSKAHVVQKYENLEDLICPLISTTAEFEKYWFQSLHRKNKKPAGPIPLEKRFTFTDVEQDVFEHAMWGEYLPIDRYRTKSYTTGERTMTFAVESPYHSRLVRRMRNCIQKTIDSIEMQSEDELDFDFSAETDMTYPILSEGDVIKYMAPDVSGSYEYLNKHSGTYKPGVSMCFPELVVEIGPADFHEQDAEYWLLQTGGNVKVVLMVVLYSTADDCVRVDVASWIQEEGRVKREVTVSAEQDKDGNRKMLDPSARLIIPYKRLFPADESETAKDRLIVIDNKYIVRLLDALKVPSVDNEDWPFEQTEVLDRG
ncbi:hypothetical protein KEM56_004568 [Ascosphaera pollenicola]|nr:hypothetical protein KEM56_004568 [Ascosphaera pollenicola]